MALVSFSFGHCIVCPLIYGFGIFFFWPLYCLSFDLWLWYIFLLLIVLSVLIQRHKSKDRQNNGKTKNIPKQ
jgi:hypothetical protein